MPISLASSSLTAGSKVSCGHAVPRKPDLNAPGAANYVGIGDDVAVFGEKDAGAGAALRGKQRCGVAGFRLVGGDVAGGEDLHNRRPHPVLTSDSSETLSSPKETGGGLTAGSVGFYAGFFLER